MVTLLGGAGCDESDAGLWASSSRLTTAQPVAQVAGPQLVVHGPVTVRRSSGPPERRTLSFELPDGLVSPFVLQIDNGRFDGSSRVTSAVIDLNGTVVAQPDDFGQKISRLQLPIGLDHANTLTVELRGKPGSELTVSILGAASPDFLTGTACGSGPSPAFPVAGEYIVALNDVANASLSAEQLRARYGFDYREVFSEGALGFLMRGSPVSADALRQDPSVAAVLQDLWIPCNRNRINDPRAVPCSPPMLGGRSLARVGASWDQESQTLPLDGQGVNVAIIESVDEHQSELVGVVSEPSCNSFDPDPDHGTQVAGVIGAREGGLATIGIAPAATLVEIPGQTIGAYYCRINRVIKRNTDKNPINDISVVNASHDICQEQLVVSRDVYVRIMQGLIRASVSSGATWVVAQGRQEKCPVSGVYYPDNFPEVITVGSYADSDGQPGALGAAVWCDGADYVADDGREPGAAANTKVDLLAPGCSILTTLSDNQCALSSGSSFAAPLVAGTVALLKQKSPSLTPAGLKSELLRVAEALPGTNVRGLRAGEYLDVDLSGPGSGHVTTVPSGISCPSDCRASFFPETSVSVAAVAAPGSVFTGWSGDCGGGTAPAVVEMLGERRCTANFSLACGSGTEFCGGSCVANACSGGRVFDRTQCSCQCPTGQIVCNDICQDSCETPPSLAITFSRCIDATYDQSTGTGSFTLVYSGPLSANATTVTAAASNREIRTIPPAFTNVPVPVSPSGTTWSVQHTMSFSHVRPAYVVGLSITASNSAGSSSVFREVGCF